MGVLTRAIEMIKRHRVRVVTDVNVKEYGCWNVCSPLSFLINSLNMCVFTLSTV